MLSDKWQQGDKSKTMSLYSKEAKRATEKKFILEYQAEKLEGYTFGDKTISIDEYNKLSPHERSVNKCRPIWKDKSQAMEQKPDTKTLQQCKDFIAKSHSVDPLNLTVWMSDEAAELYASQFQSQLTSKEAEIAELKHKADKFEAASEQYKENWTAAVARAYEQQKEIKELREALKEALPYVVGAYDCAFLDESENLYIKEKIKSLLQKHESK